MDTIFKALNDPNRRAILDALRHKDGQSLSDLQARIDMTRFGVMKHIGVLETSGLVVSKRVGRFKYHYLNPLPLQEVVDRWVEPLLARHTRRILTLKSELETDVTKPDFMAQTFIRCSQASLWAALTKAEAYAHYDFLEQTAERQGDTVIYRLPDGTVTLHARDVEVVPMTRLVTTFEPKWDDETTPSRVVYLIEVEGDFCKLTVEHHGLNHDPDGGTADGWYRSLAGLKTWLETGTDANFGGAYLMEQHDG